MYWLQASYENNHSCNSPTLHLHTNNNFLPILAHLPQYTKNKTVKFLFILSCLLPSPD